MVQRRFLNIREVLSVVPDGSDCHAIRNFNFMNKQQPASVGQLAYDLGFEVRREALDFGVSARLEPDTWSTKGFELVVNANQSKLRQRFSALHEIAHYYLHGPKADFLAVPKHRASGTFDHVYSSKEMIEEYEANEWADAVIFGDQALEAAIGLYGKEVEKLARHFGFSIQVVHKAMNRRDL